MIPIAIRPARSRLNILLDTFRSFAVVDCPRFNEEIRDALRARGQLHRENASGPRGTGDPSAGSTQESRSGA